MVFFHSVYCLGWGGKSVRASHPEKVDTHASNCELAYPLRVASSPVEL
uniref:Uncharacterized protein n=1 Tax=Siphoviridae sp. ct4T77 TaxID=2823563 RepID=A0A8S5L935_9CAUD|nr:MAG TPA: hypothetical protein [Siphoviridae sp. ct4T77]